jgi:hypothetical protein
MDCRRIIMVLALARVLLGSGSPDVPEPAVRPTLSRAAQEGPVKVFILAGQSNMEGHGQIPSLDHLGDHPKYGYLLKGLKDADGSWAVRHDVTVSYRAQQRKEQCGPLTVGWGATDREIGPELMFGTIMGEHYPEQVLLIKTAWGGKDVFCDFRSPGAGPPVGEEAALLEKQASGGRKREIGLYYRQMVAEIKECLAHIEDIVSGYGGQGYEIAGMAWFQGWNDLCQWSARIEDRQVGLGIIERYSHNLAAMFRDLRQDLGVPDLPIVIGELGVGGHEMTKRAENPRDREAVAMVKFRPAQRAVADDPSLQNVTFVSTLDFWDTRWQELWVMADKYQRVQREQKIPDPRDNVLPTQELTEEYWRWGGHWYGHDNGSATTYSRLGFALAQALMADANLALTPPRGWNRWKAFQKDMDEVKIQEIADVLVASGRRDAGYTYLVLEDAWRASERDGNGRLVADPRKFPHGRKALGDYIHRQGLKFGLYQDRGRRTCPPLPGSFGHERIDRETFAAWGVDYIQMDSCFAESNGRMSSES